MEQVLIAYAGHQMGRLDRTHRAYQWMNLLGSPILTIVACRADAHRGSHGAPRIVRDPQWAWGGGCGSARERSGWSRGAPAAPGCPARQRAIGGLGGRPEPPM
jgi:hypothetical protein